MRIVLDLQGCQNGGRGRGIGRYGIALTRAMAAAGRGHEFVVVLNAGFPGTIGSIRAELADAIPQDRILTMALPEDVSSADPDNAWRTRAAEIQRAQFIDGLAPDLIFTASLFEGYHDRTVVSVEPQRAPTAVTLYDFIPMDYPEVYLPSGAIRAAYERKLCDARQADLLLPISRYVADQAIARLGVSADRVVCAPLGVEPWFRPVALDAATRAALLRRWGVTRRFVLNTSPVEFRKNLGRLIDGFAAMSPPMRDAYQLVIVGRVSTEQRRELFGRAERAGLPSDTVVLPGFVPDDDLVALYGACELFAFPSLSEGFGLPVLEAMACGAPVIGSSTTSIPEVIGREDLLFDPLDVRGLGARMEAVLGDARLREELRDYGIARAVPFTWERTAETVLDAFERVVRTSAETMRAGVEDQRTFIGADVAARLATALPPAVRGVPPDADDLADVAEAAARNEALLRPACLWLDVGASRPADDRVRVALEAARRHSGGQALTCRRLGDRLEVVSGEPDDAWREDGEAAFRPGDRLVVVSGLGSSAPEAVAALQRATDAGAILACACGPAGALDALIERVAELGPAVRPALHLVDEAGDAFDGPKTVVVADVQALVEAGLPVQVVAVGASPETTQALRSLLGRAPPS